MSEQDIEKGNTTDPETKDADFTPRIVGFLCNWCSYAAADLCGVSRYQYPDTLRVVRVMCSARVDMSLILELLLQGADGVIVGGCHLGDCHYLSGNYYTQERIRIVTKLVEKTGLEPERVRLEWISASEGERFSKVLTEFTECLRKLGPSPIKGKDPNTRILESCYVAKNISEDFRLRALVSNYLQLTDKGNVYGRTISKERLNELIDRTIDDEFVRQWILYMTRYKPKTVEQIHERTGIPKDKIVVNLITLKDRGLITMESHDPPSPTYLSHAIAEVMTEAEQEVMSIPAPSGGDRE